MLLEELVEQHRVHRFIADCVTLAVLVASHQIRVNLFHFLSHEAELRNAIGVKLLLVMEGDRFEREDRFASLVHRFNRFLETSRRCGRAQMTAGINNHADASRHRDATNPSNICTRLRSCRSDSDYSSLASYASVADINIVISRG